MKKSRLILPVIAGLMVGQLFAESERPFSVANTVRFGYNDNLYFRDSGESKGSTFVTDIIDLSFRAALSDRTDVILKSQFNILSDDGGNEIYPNLYAMLNHGISPRVLLGISEIFRSGDRAGRTDTGTNKRYNYYENRVEGSADYVLDQKNLLKASVGNSILRNEDDKKNRLFLDNTEVDAGMTWKHEIAPQRTYSLLNLRQSRVSYDNGTENTITTNGAGTNIVRTARFYLDDKAYYDATDLSAGLSHTFNPEWQGSIEAGVTYLQPNFSDSIVTTRVYTNSPVSGLNEVDNDPNFSPLLRAGLVYSPSPGTRLTSDLSVLHKASDTTGYGGQDTAELRFGAQHELTAKLMAKATIRFANTKYDAQDDVTGSKEERTEDRMDLDFRLTYKLNRINFLETGVRHSVVDRDVGEDWEQNMVDVGWRVELN